MSNYIFGYGSLLETQSRTLTVPSAIHAFPAKVYGFTRGWWARTKVVGISTTYLGCLDTNSKYLDGYNKVDYVNGIIFQVSSEDLAMLDDREKNYKRVQLDPRSIHVYDVPLQDFPIWVYTNEFLDHSEFLQSFPEKNFPVVQSYVDVCINGCLEIEQNFPQAKSEGFLQDFILSTIFWSKFWANDRITPRRPHIHCKNAYLIDRLLKEHLRDKSLFDEIYIE